MTGYEGTAYDGSAPPSSGSASVVRILIGVAVVLVTLGGLAGGLRGPAEGGAQAAPAPGPPLTLATVAPEMVLGRTPSSDALAADDRSTTLDRMRALLGPIPGSSPAAVEIYGPGPEGPPDRGLGIVTLVWTASSAPFSQDELAAGFSEAAVRADDGRATTTTAPDGGVVVCHESVPEIGPTSLCVWIRSGTGLVALAEHDVPADTVRADLAGVVAQMARA